MTVNFDENPSGSQCKLDSIVQGAGKGTEERGDKTNRSERSQRMGGRKNSEQKEDKRSRKVFSAVERVHGRRGYMRKEREPKECRRVDRRIQREDECGNKKVRENRHGRGERL